jgi:hypothetical protein
MTERDVSRRVTAILGRNVVASRPLGGGCVADVRELELEGGFRCVAKVAAAGGLEVEGWMLKYLAANTPLPVPAVLYADDRLLLLERVACDRGGISSSVEREAADHLAALHQVTSTRFGLERDTTIGGLLQPNPWSVSWREFFRDQRLLHIGRRALDAGAISGACFSRTSGSLSRAALRSYTATCGRETCSFEAAAWLRSSIRRSTSPTLRSNSPSSAFSRHSLTISSGAMPSIEKSLPGFSNFGGISTIGTRYWSTRSFLDRHTRKPYSAPSCVLSADDALFLATATRVAGRPPGEGAGRVCARGRVRGCRATHEPAHGSEGKALAQRWPPARAGNVSARSPTHRLRKNSLEMMAPGYSNRSTFGVRSGASSGVVTNECIQSHTELGQR